MFTQELFLGVPQTKGLKEALKKANPHLVALLTGGNEYLEVVEKESTTYLGKRVESCPTLEELDDVERHISSLLAKVAPLCPLAPAELIGI